MTTGNTDSVLNSDPFPTVEGHLADRDTRFQRYRKTLKHGQAWRLGMTPESLALTALGDLEALLRAGQPTKQTLNLLADFIGTIGQVSRISNSDRDGEAKLAFRVLGYRPNGRPTKKYAEQQAAVAFQVLMEAGRSEVDAVKVAYDVYQESMGNLDRTYSSQSVRAVSVTKGADKIETNEADRFIERVISPMLRDAGVLSPKAPGRKRKA